MPNWAINDCTVTGDERELKSLYETIKMLENQPESRVENDFGKQWLGNLVDALGEDWRKIHCRGYWTEAHYSEGQISMSIESAWTAPTDVFSLITTKYPSLSVLYYCEEPGCDIYETNDRYSLFYHARFIAKVCLKEYEHGEDYFDTIEDALEWISQLSGKNIRSTEELKGFGEELQEKDGSLYCYIEEIKVV